MRVSNEERQYMWSMKRWWRFPSESVVQTVDHSFAELKQRSRNPFRICICGPSSKGQPQLFRQKNFSGSLSKVSRTRYTSPPDAMASSTSLSMSSRTSGRSRSRSKSSTGRPVFPKRRQTPGTPETAVFGLKKRHPAASPSRARAKIQ